MIDLNELSHRERVLLAGCIKAMVMIDANLEIEELDYLDELCRTAHFEDFDKCLAESEGLFLDEQSLIHAVADIKNHQSRALMRETLREVSLRGSGLDSTRSTVGDTFYDRICAALS